MEVLKCAVKSLTHVFRGQFLFLPVERDCTTGCLPAEVLHKGIPVGHPILLNPDLGTILQMESHQTAEDFQNRLGDKE